MLENQKLRKYAKLKRVRLWELAEMENISEGTLCRLLRHELDPDAEMHYEKLIDQISSDR